MILSHFTSDDTHPMMSLTTGATDQACGYYDTPDPPPTYFRSILLSLLAHLDLRLALPPSQLLAIAELCFNTSLILPN